ncbi:MAG: M67 family metallopeptidase [Sphaerobacter sp.]|nr:M67 family metallopeptidase [Sphaerobacter sp.]
MATGSNPPVLVLAPALAEAIARHGEGAYPEECCGVLLGRVLPQARVVERLVPITNRWDAGERSRRFLIGPDDVLRAERESRQQGYEVLGFYHSHPDDLARPSAFDREHAWPWYVYVIASIRHGRWETSAAWQLCDDRSGYDAIALVSSLAPAG